MKAYIVTLKFRFPAWDEGDGIEFRVTARTRAEAIRTGRKTAKDAGHTIGRGEHWFTAREADDNLPADWDYRP